jgi:hypothetical protein
LLVRRRPAFFSVDFGCAITSALLLTSRTMLCEPKIFLYLIPPGIEDVGSCYSSRGTFVPF